MARQHDRAAALAAVTLAIVACTVVVAAEQAASAPDATAPSSSLRAGGARNLARGGGAKQPPRVGSREWQHQWRRGDPLPEGYEVNKYGMPVKIRDPKENERFKKVAAGIDVPDDDSTYATYPEFCTMGQLLENWPVLDMSPPPTFDMCDTVRRLDYTDPDQLAEAMFLRDAELPVILYNIPQVEAARLQWTDEYIGAQYGGGRQKIRVTVSDTNHILYFSDKKGVRTVGVVDDEYADMEDPVHDEMVSYEEFAAHCLTPPDPDDKHWYWQFKGDGSSTHQHAWVQKALPMFQAGATSPFIVERDWASHELMMRAGMAGVFMEAHWDGSKNFVTMIRGHRRYILNPPDQCDRMGLRHGGGSDRQTVYDFTSPDKPRRDYHEVAPPEFYEARAIDVVISAGDALYLPTRWMHTPVSLDKNIQANVRSGSGMSGTLQIGVKCEFGSTRVNEDVLAQEMSNREMIRTGEYELLPLDMPRGGKLMTGERPLLSSNGAVLEPDYDDTFGGRGPGASNMDTASTTLITRHATAFADARRAVNGQAAENPSPFANPMWVALSLFAGVGLLAMGYQIAGRVRASKAGARGGK